MEIDSKITNKIAHLARLNLTEDELADHQIKLSQILTWVEQLNEVDTDSIEPLYHAIDEATQPLRNDEVTEKDHRDEYQSLSHKHKAGLYLVPTVIE